MRLKIEDSTNVYFSSDFHFHHQNITGPTVSEWKTGYRNFSSIHEMNDTIFEGINTKVGEDDILIFFGDLCFKNHKLIPEIFNRILCKNIYWIKGNHDQKIDLYKNCVLGVFDSLEIEYKNEFIVCSHYPMLSWNRMGKGSWDLHGHCHSNLNINKLNESCKRLDIGVDHYFRLYGKYEPFSFNEVKELMDKKQVEIIDHHNKNTGI